MAELNDSVSSSISSSLTDVDKEYIQGVGIEDIVFVTLEDSGDLQMTIKLTDGTEKSTILPRGPKGDKGEDGKEGPRGPHGHIGLTGPKGDQGEIGRGLVIDGTAKTPMDLPIPDPESEYLNKIYLVGENLYVCVGLKNGEGFTPNFAWRKVGPACPKGDDAYTIWRNNQIEAGVNEDQILTEEQWLESLKGKDVLQLLQEVNGSEAPYDSIEHYVAHIVNTDYKKVILELVAVGAGKDADTFTEADLVTTLQGNGILSTTQEKSESGDTKVTFVYTKTDPVEITIPKGDKGDPGNSAYQQWKEDYLSQIDPETGHPYESIPDEYDTEDKWRKSYLRGPKGDSAYKQAKDYFESTHSTDSEDTGSEQFPGTVGEWLQSLQGKDGLNGKSAYQLAKESWDPEVQGINWPFLTNTGADDQAAWVRSLKGDKGDKGDQGDNAYITWKKFNSDHVENADTELTFQKYIESITGPSGIPGASAYDIAASAGLVDKTEVTQSEWIQSLQGRDGTNGKSAYEIYLDQQSASGNQEVLSEKKWIESLKGDPGAPFRITGKYESIKELEDDFNHTNVKEGEFAIILPKDSEGHLDQSKEEYGYLYLKETASWTFICDISESATQGPKGDDGKSAYELYLDHFDPETDGELINSEHAWVRSLKGEKGDKGDQGERGVSAFELAQRIYGTEPPYDSVTNWLASLKGTDGLKGDRGDAGESAWQIYVKHGGELSEQAWLTSLKGDSAYISYCDLIGIDPLLDSSKTKFKEALKGEKGERGLEGPQGKTGETGKQGDAGVGIKDIQYIGTLSADNDLGGKEGDYAYRIALTDNSNKTIYTPRGPRGETGLQGLRGPQGIQGPTGERGSNLVFSCLDDVKSYISSKGSQCFGQLVTICMETATTVWYIDYSGGLNQINTTGSSADDLNISTVSDWFTTGVISFSCKDDALRAIRECKGKLNNYLCVIRNSYSDKLPDLYSINEYASDKTDEQVMTLLSKSKSNLSASHSIILDTTQLTQGQSVVNNSVGYTIDWESNKMTITLGADCLIHAFPTVKLLNSSGVEEGTAAISYGLLQSPGKLITITWNDFNSEKEVIRYIILS